VPPTKTDDSRAEYAQAPESLVVGLARTGDRGAFAELVRRRQSWIRNLLRRLGGDATLADDLAQQTFLQAWRSIAGLRQAQAFGAWLKRLAVNTWLQHQRRQDALSGADEFDQDADPGHSQAPANGLAMDLDAALATLAAPVRLCLVLAYVEGLSHGEIAEIADLPAGTVKSHIRRGAQRLRQLLSAYADRPESEDPR
jgi:RNA polymerase sigma-70 factor (ECF subfamily)